MDETQFLREKKRDSKPSVSVSNVHFTDFYESVIEPEGRANPFERGSLPQKCFLPFQNHSV